MLPSRRHHANLRSRRQTGLGIVAAFALAAVASSLCGQSMTPESLSDLGFVSMAPNALRGSGVSMGETGLSGSKRSTAAPGASAPGASCALVVSAAALALAMSSQRRATRRRAEKTKLEDLSKGQQASGKVKRIAKLGVWVDIGAEKDALLPAAQIPAGKTYAVDDPIEAIISEVQAGDTPELRQIRLEMKQAAVSVKAAAPSKPYQVGGIFEGKVKSIALQTKGDEKVPFGAFVDIGVGINVLLPTREMQGTQVNPGDDVKVKVLQITTDGDKDKITVTMNLNQLPIDTLREGQTVSGVVKSVLPGNGAFVDIGTGKDALLRLSQLDDKNLTDFKVGDKIAGIRVRSVDKASKKVELTMRPFARDTKVGQRLEGTVSAITDSGIRFDAGLTDDVFADSNQLVKDKSEYTQGAVVDLKVLKVVDNRVFVTTRGENDPEEGTASAESIASLPVGSIVDGKVKRISEIGIFIDIGSDRDALYASNQWDKPKEEYKVGEILKGLTVSQNQTEPSRRLGVTYRKTVAAYELKGKITGKVSKKIAVGLFVEFGESFEAFLPSRNLEKATDDYKVGDELVDLTISEIDTSKNRMTVQQKESGGKAGGRAAGKVSMNDLVVGSKMPAVVRMVKEYGIFVDIGLGAKDALLSASTLGKDRTLESFNPNDSLEVFIARIDKDTGRVSVVLKEADIAAAGPRKAGRIRDGGQYSGSDGSIKSLHPKYNWITEAPYELLKGEKWDDGNRWYYTPACLAERMVATKINPTEANREHFLNRPENRIMEDWAIPWLEWEKKYPTFCKFEEFTLEGTGNKERNGCKWYGEENVLPSKVVHIPVPAHLRKPDAAMPDLGPDMGMPLHEQHVTWDAKLPWHISTKYRQAPFNTPNWTAWRTPESEKTKLQESIDQRANEREQNGLPPVPIKPVGKAWLIPVEVVKANPWKWPKGSRLQKRPWQKMGTPYDAPSNLVDYGPGNNAL